MIIHHLSAVFALTVWTMIFHPRRRMAKTIFAPPQRALFAAVPTILLLILMAKVITGGVPAETALARREWMTLVFNPIHDGIPRNERPMNIKLPHLGIELLLTLVPFLINLK